MIGWVMFGTNDLEKSTKFYNNFIEKLELVKTLDEKEFVGYAKKDEPEKVMNINANSVKEIALYLKKMEVI